MTPPVLVAYLMCPVSPSNGHTVEKNLEVAEVWLHFLRGITRDLIVDGRHVAIIAPWIASIRVGADESSGADRAHGLRDDCAVAARCDLVIAAGVNKDDALTSGMRLEREACAGPLVDLMEFSGWEWPEFMTATDMDRVVGRIEAGMRDAVESGTGVDAIQSYADVRTVRDGNPFLVAVTYTHLLGDLFPGAEVMLQVDDDVLNAAAGNPGAVEYVHGSTRTIVVEVNGANLSLSNREPAADSSEAAAAALARQRQQRIDYLAMGPTASLDHSVELKIQGIVATWRETRREVAQERASGVRVDRIERIAEEVERALSCYFIDPESSRRALAWLNGARVSIAELGCAMDMSMAHVNHRALTLSTSVVAPNTTLSFTI